MQILGLPVEGSVLSQGLLWCGGRRNFETGAILIAAVVDDDHTVALSAVSGGASNRPSRSNDNADLMGFARRRA